MDDGKPAYTYNWFGLESYTVKSPTAVGEGSAEVKLVFAYDGEGPGKGGQATLYINGEQVADGRIEKTEPFVFSADETADVGKDDATQVVNFLFEDVEDSEFTGYVRRVEVKIPEGE
jgi:arylsulfatase